MNVVETRGLTKCFGKKVAVKNFSMTVTEGEIYGFLGENGAGKSTTFRVLLGFIWPDQGEAFLRGVEVSPGSGKALMGVGAMMEAPYFYGHLSAEENLRLFAELSGPVTKARIDEAISLLGLEEQRGQKAGTLSHGQRQRLGIAQALLPDNRLLLLDEPQNGLDPLWVKKLRELLRDLAAKGVTILISSHRLHEIEQVCDRVGIIHKGDLLYEGPVAPLLALAEYVEVRCDRPIEAAAHLMAQGFEVKPSTNGSLSARAPEGRDAARLNRFLLEAGFEVSEMVRKRVTLEEIFLELTYGREETPR
ncbi:MAG: ABC transporter ATP-binding protein [Candidatus Omnitrophica bacterium]|nr:ABC transporter ATP-binding protein [Candidatus Omnitrophota bacterium]